MQAWDSEGTGLIVSERLVNCPPQLAPPLVKGLFDEISTAAKSEVRSLTVQPAAPLPYAWDSEE